MQSPCRCGNGLKETLMDPGFQLANRQAKSYEELSGVFMGPSAKLIVEAIKLEPGDIVLDLACGTGLVARCAWPEVCPSARTYSWPESDAAPMPGKTMTENPLLTTGARAAGRTRCPAALNPSPDSSPRD